jgi:VanZ family protein
MQAKSLRFIQFIPAIIMFAISFYLFTLPGSQIPKIDWMDTINGDKIVHAGLFAAMGFLFGVPFKKSIVSIPKRKFCFFIILIAGIGYGTSIEFIQRDYVANRSFDVLDIVADSLGCLVAYVWSLKYFLKVKLG